MRKKRASPGERWIGCSTIVAGYRRRKQKKIKEIAEKMGYRPNIAGKGLAARKMHLKIGFIYLDSDAAPFHRAIYEGALAYARQELEPYGIEVIFFPISVIVEDPTSLEQEGYLRN